MNMRLEDMEKVRTEVRKIMDAGLLGPVEEVLDALGDLLDSIDTSGGEQTRRQLSQVNEAIGSTGLKVACEGGRVVVYFKDYRMVHLRQK